MAEAPLAVCRERQGLAGDAEGRCATGRAHAGAAGGVAVAAGGELQRGRIRVVPRRLHRDLAQGRATIRIRSCASACSASWRARRTDMPRRSCSKACRTPTKRWCRLRRRCSSSATTSTRTPMRRRARSSTSRQTRWRKREALRLLAADATAAPMFEKLLRDKNELREIRQISASALHALEPEKLQEHAREILLDKSDYDDIKATSLTALQQFGDDEALGKDKALLKSVIGFASARRRRSTSRRPGRFLEQVRPVGGATDAGRHNRARMSEPQFAALVDALAADPDRREQLTGLLARRSSASTPSAGRRRSSGCAAGFCSPSHAPGCRMPR